MGRVRNNRRKNSKKKEYKKAFKTDNRARDVDQIQEDLIKEKERGEKMAFAADDDLPGLGQFYCTPCGRHFFDEASLTSHANSRGHVRRYLALSHYQLFLYYQLIVLYEAPLESTICRSLQNVLSQSPCISMSPLKGLVNSLLLFF